MLSNYCVLFDLSCDHSCRALVGSINLPTQLGRNVATIGFIQHTDKILLTWRETGIKVRSQL